MRRIRVATCSIDSTVGAVNSNLNKAVAAAKRMHKAGATIVVMQENLLGGYPAEDLILSHEFVLRQWEALRHFAEATKECPGVVYVVGLVVRVESDAYNCAAFVMDGKVLGIVPKEDLPTYGVFYEARVFTAGAPGLYRELAMKYHTADRFVSYKVPFGDLVFEFPFGTVTAAICEDTWTPKGFRRTAEIYCVPNASPGRAGVLDVRRNMLSTRSADNECVIAAAYAVGGNDSLVFDGGGFVFQNGELLSEAKRFSEHETWTDVDLSRTERMRGTNTTWRTRANEARRQGESFRRIAVPDGPSANTIGVSREFAERFSFLPKDPRKRKERLDEIVELMIGGLDGYLNKNPVFKTLLVSNSGGKDSVLTLIVAWLYAQRRFAGLSSAKRGQAIKDFIIAVSQPTHFNSKETKSVARDVSEFLGVTFMELSIEETFKMETDALRALSGKEPDKKTLGNVQARIRAGRMWNLSNERASLWLQTGNMSERAVGYTTIGGDLEGAYSLIGNLPKTVVIELLRHLAEKYGLLVIDRLLKLRASAELEEGQFDEDQLMPFEVLDTCYLLFAGEWYAPDDLYRIMRARWTDEDLRAMVSAGQPYDLKPWIERFVFLFRISIYKWVKMCEGVHIGNLDLDRERCLQIPVVTSGEWLERSIKEMRALL